MTLNDKIHRLLVASPMMQAALLGMTEEATLSLRASAVEMTDDIEAVIIEELNIIDAEYQTDCTAKIKAQHAGEPTELTDEEVAFFEACLKPDLRVAWQLW